MENYSYQTPLVTAITIVVVAFSPTPKEMNFEKATPLLPFEIRRDIYDSRASSMIISINHALTGDLIVDYYQPKTELGRKLIAWRKEYIESGEKLLDNEEILEKVRAIRGGYIHEKTDLS